MSETEHISELAPTTVGMIVENVAHTVADVVEEALADAIRIVPLKGARRHPSPGRLSYRGGPLLTSVRLVPVFWGSGWGRSPALDLIAPLTTYLAWLPASPVIAQLAEYGLPGKAIGNGTCVAPTLDPEALPPSLTDSTIQGMLATRIEDGTLPAPTDQTLYVLLFGPGVAIVQGGAKSCQAWCGYHSATASGVYYAVLPFLDCSGCLGPLATLEALTEVASHEVAEAVTDPRPGSGWYNAVHGEVGDYCTQSTKVLDGWTVQTLWSNHARACV